MSDDDEADVLDPRPRPVSPKRPRGSLGQSIGGVLFGFEQAVLRTTPPPQELVHHARPDDPIPSGDGHLIRIGLPPDLEVPVSSPAGTPDTDSDA
jgi:hypothetical protein